MVSVVGGSGLGLLRTSGATVGAGGVLGSSGLGQVAQGVTVNASTGNLIIQTQDEFLAGMGLGAVFASSYNSLGAATGNYTNLDGSQDADGWLLNTQRKIVLAGTGNAAGSTATLTDWDGTQVVFTYNSTSGRYESTESPYNDDFLTWSANVFTWTEGRSRTVQTFAANVGGRIISFADADGNTVSFSYDAATTAGKLTRVTTSNSSAGQNNWVDYVYGANSLTLTSSYYDLATSSNKTQSRVAYTFDAANRLSTVTTDLTPLNSADSVTYTVTYSYKDSTSKLVTGIAQSDGTSLTIAYDASNRVSSISQAMDSGVSQSTSFSYDTTGRVTTITDALSNQYKMGYNTAGRLVRLEEPAPVAGGNATVKTFSYDAYGNPTEVLTFDNPASVGNASLAIEVTRSRYDAASNLLERVYGDGSAVVYTYGALNELLSQASYTGLDANGLADGTAPTGGMTTRYIYDAAGNGVADDGSTSGDDAAERHLRFTVSAEGRVYEYRYNGAGLLIATIGYTSNVYTGTSWSEADLAAWVATADKSQTQRSDNAYDFRGNLIQTTSWSATDSTGAGLAAANWSRADYTYDQAGRLLTRRISGTNDLGGEAAPVTESFVYDGLGRMISATDLFGATSTIAINDGTRTTTITTPNAATKTQVFKISGALASDTVSAAGTATATTSFTYDALGRLRMATDPSGVKTYYVYDRQGRLTATIDDNGTLSEVKYDGADRVVASVTYATAVSAANLTLLGTVTTNTEVAAIRPAASAADRWQWTIYDKAGRVIETIDAAGAVVKFDYDGAGRLATTTAYSAKLAASTVGGVDGLSGYRTSPPSALVTTTANMAEDRVNQNLYDNDGLLVGTVLQQAESANGQIVEYVYDKAGRLIDTITYANTVTQANWQGKTLAQIKAVLTLDAAKDSHSYLLYDGRGRLGAAIDGEGNVTRYHYTARGDLDQEVRGQQVTAATFYTLASLPTASGTLETTRWFRNAAGLVTSQVRTLSGGTETTTYAYDNRGRLLTQTVSETISTESRSRTFRYDAKGRLTGQLGGVSSAALAALGASPSQAQIDGVYATYGTQYAYDIADRLIQTITPDGSGAGGFKSLFYYDSDGQLRFEINALGEITEYRYNALEDRTDTVQYGARLSSSTLAGLSGGLVTATITNAVLPLAQGGIGDTAKDSRIQAIYDNLGRIIAAIDALGYTSTSGYNAFSQTSQLAGPTTVSPNFGMLQSYSYFSDGQVRSSTASVNGVNGASLYQGYSYDTAGRRTSLIQNTYDNRTSTWAYDRASKLVTQRDNFNSATTLAYDARSNLISSIDRTGKTTTYGYDLFSRNVTITTSEGVATSVKVNAFGQTILLTDGKGNTTSYAYDKNGNLKSVTDAAGTTTSNYDIADRLIETIDAKGAVTRYTYDAVGRVLTEVRDYGAGKLNLAATYAYDAKGQVTSVTDASGGVTTYTYDLRGQKTRVVQDAGSGKLNLTTDFVYRADGKLISQTEAVGTAQQRRTVFEYDTVGRPTKQTLDADGVNALSTSYFYDVNNNRVAMIEASNTAQARTTRFVFDLNNRLTASIDALGNVTQYFYDAEDRTVASRAFTNALSAAQLSAFADHTQPNQWTELSSAVNGDLTITKKVKDLATGAITATTVTTLAAAASDRVSRTFYDGDGRAVYAVDAEGYVTQNVYDKANNVIQTVRYAAAATGLTNASTTANVAAQFTTTLSSTGGLATNIPTSAVVTTYTYDTANRLTDVTDGEGTVSHIVLDALGLKTDVTVGYGTADAVTSHFVYDALGRVVDETRAYNTGNPADAVTTHYVYDVLGQITDVTVASNSTTGEAVTSHRTYDALGRILSEVRDYGGINAATLYTYDALGRAVKVVDARNNASYLYYDALDRVTQAVDAEGYVTKTEYLSGTANTKVIRYYNKATNAATLTPATMPTVTADAARDVVNYALFDKLDRMVWSLDGEGYAVKTVYQIGGSIASVTRYANKASNAATLTIDGAPTVTIDAAKDATSSFAYDRNGRVLTLTDAQGAVESFAYNALGQRTSVTNKLGGITTYTYTKTGQVKTESVQQKSYDANGNALMDGAAVATAVVTTYSYDLRGNLKSKVAGSNLGTNALTASFAYDKLDRLIQQTDPAFANPDGSGTLTPVTQWAYDKLGNVVQQTAPDLGKTFCYYDKLGRKVSEVSSVGTLSQWSYDASGNLTNQKICSDSVSLPVSPGGAPPAASGTARETQLSYDKNGRLTQSVVVGVRTGSFNSTSYITTANQNLTSTNLYDGLGNLIKEIDANGNAILHWFDRTGREVAKLDQELYLTSWTRDADGNVLQETRFAAKFTGTPNPNAAAPTATADAANDRTTTFTYDKLGRRLTEVRLAVVAATISGNTVSTASQSATVAYSYNALGEVLSKTEATGDRADYQYDVLGRLIRQLDVVQADHNSAGTASVRHITYFKYDGANNLVFAAERAEAGTAVSNASITPDAMGTLASGYVATDDRITRYTYNGGKLTAMADALGFTRSYVYDAAGRKTAEYYTRTRSDGIQVTEGNFTAYDLAGRATSQWQASSATAVNPVWAAIWPRTLLNYNAFGEVTSRQIKASASDTSPLTQEQMAYDNAGRVVKTNAGDGVWKALVYDANGNATLSISAVTRDMSADTVDTVLTAFGAVDSSTNATMAATITTFDKRNMAAQTREPQRQIDTTTNRYSLTRARSYTAFGEVASETDARGNTTNYTYNTLGRATRAESPTVSITNEDGSTQYVRPSSDYYYDKSGRLVATRDANGSYATGGTSAAGTSKAANTGNLTTRQLLAGTGYGGSEARVTKEFRGDASVWESRYDAFGQLRVSLDGLQRATTSSFDKGGRITQTSRPSGYSDSYTYDELGQRTRHWNSQLGAGVVERTDYDSQGRIIASRSYAGDLTTTAYTLHTLANTGMGLSGGWTKQVTDAAGHSTSESGDHFGRVLTRTNMASQATTSAYNRAGQLTGVTALGGANISYSYYNSGLLATSVDTAGTGLNTITATLTYDKSGNRIGEKQVGTVWNFGTYGSNYENATAQVLQDATVVYDALNRVASFTNKNAAGTVEVSIATVYDAAGNVRRVTSTYPDLAYPGNPAITSTKWYKYDALGRMVMADGAQTVATQVTNVVGELVTYNAAGERATQTKGNAGLTGQVVVWVWYPGYEPGGTGGNVGTEEGQVDGVTGTYQTINVGYAGARREKYTYNADGQLTQMESATTGYVDNGDGTISSTQIFGAYELRAQTTRDAGGRITTYQEFAENSNGVTVTQSRYGVTYDLYDRVVADNVSQRRLDANTHLAQTTNSYAAAGGALASSTVKNWLNGNDANAADTLMTYTLAWVDGSRVASSSYDGDTATTSNPLFSSTYTYDGTGRTAKVVIADGRPRTVSFASTLEGQVLLRKERSSATANPEDRHYFLGGVQQGEITNNGNNDPERTDWNQTILTHTWQANPNNTPFRWNTATGVTAAQMGQDGYDPLNASGQGMSGTDMRYIARGGESLAQVAQSMWGDASLWYTLAQANGMSGGETLAAGQSLVVPDKVVSNTNNAGTWRPYDAAHAVGDLSPTTAKPPKKNTCGFFGQILAVIVAVVAAKYLGPIGGNLASQAFNNLMGLQKGFSAASLATSMLTFGLSGGTSGNILIDAARSALTNAAVQQVLVRTGLQKDMDWAGVAAAGVSGMVSGQLGKLRLARPLGTAGAAIASATASGLAGAAATSLVTGNDFGDTLIAQLPAIIGEAAGAGINTRIKGGGWFGVLGNGGALGDALDRVFHYPKVAIAAVAGFIAGTVPGAVYAAVTGGGYVASQNATGRLDNQLAIRTRGLIEGSHQDTTPQAIEPADRGFNSFADLFDEGAVQQGMASGGSRGAGARRRQVASAESSAEFRRDSLIMAWEYQDYWKPPRTQKEAERKIADRRAHLGSMEKAARADGNIAWANELASINPRRPTYSNGRPAYWSTFGKVNLPKVKPSLQQRPAEGTSPTPQRRPVAATGSNVAAEQPPPSDIVVEAVRFKRVGGNKPFELISPRLLAPTADLSNIPQQLALPGSIIDLTPQNYRLDNRFAYNSGAGGSGSGSSLALEVASGVAHAFPVIGTGLSVYSLFSGEDLITGQKVSRWSAATDLALSFVPFGGILSKGKKFAKIGGELAEHLDDAAAAGRRIDELEAAASAAERGAILGPTGKQYSVAFETKLDPTVWGRSDKVHFNRANAALDDVLRSDPAFAAQMDTLIPGVQNSVARAGGRQNPTGWTWHHGSEPGSMQLVPTVQHTDARFWNAFHPNGVGGYNIWAIPAGAPPRR